MTRATGRTVMLLATAWLASCASASVRPVPPAPPQLPDATRGRAGYVPPDSYWEPLAPDTRWVRPRPVALPIPGDAIVRAEGAPHVWDEIGEAARDRLRKDGVVVLGAGAAEVPRWQTGAFYSEWRDRRVPYVVTLDALFSLTHRALSRALGEVEHRELAPLLEALCARLDSRLAAENKRANVELRGGYAIARGIIAVARAVFDPRYVPPPDVAAVVKEETALVEAHAGSAKSPLLGVVIDYARFSVPPASGSRGAYRALSWLAAAPMSLVGTAEARNAPVDVGAARHHARAAMLLARLADPEVDPAIHGGLSRISRVLAFIWGPSDDLTPLALGDLAAATRIDLAKANVITNVVDVDKLRARARGARAPALWDGSGGAFDAGVSARIFGSHASADTIALATFAIASRELPSSLDVAAFLDAPDARAAARESRIDQRAGYEATLARVVATRPSSDAPSLHASIHGSLLDALLTWARAPADGRPADRARLESILASWTLVRHGGRPFIQRKPPPARAEAPSAGGSAALPAFVEPEPAVIARLVATVGQARRGLARLGPLPSGSRADAVLAETEELLRGALRVAERAAREEPLGPSELALLAAFPARLAAIESEPADESGPYAAVLHADPATGRALVSSTGVVEPMLVVTREPGTPRLFMAVGAHLAHHEAILPTGEADGAAVLLERRVREGKAVRAAWTARFRMAQ